MHADVRAAAPPAATAGRRPTEDRRAEIVAALIRLVAQSGPAEATTARIAAELDLTQGAVFKHFPTKEAIRAAAMDWIATSLFEALEAAERGAPSPLEALHAVYLAHVRFVVAHPGVPALIFNELQQAADSPVKARARALLARYRSLLVGLIEAARHEGDVAVDTDSAAAATLFIGTVQGLMMQAMLSGSMRGMKPRAERVYGIWLRGIRSAA